MPSFTKHQKKKIKIKTVVEKSTEKIVDGYTFDSFGNYVLLTPYSDLSYLDQIGLKIYSNDPFPDVVHKYNVFLGKQSFTYKSNTIVLDLEPEKCKDWTETQLEKYNKAMNEWREQKLEHKKQEELLCHKAKMKGKEYAMKRYTILPPKVQDFIQEPPSYLVKLGVKLDKEKLPKG